MLADIAARVAAGARITRDEALALYTSAPTPLLGRLADDIRRQKHPHNVVTYIIDRNVNYTNVCVARCRFCAFYRPVGSAEGYTLGFEEICRKIEETVGLGGGQLLLQGGHNPDIPIEWYEDLFRRVKQRYERFRLHALSPPEVIHISRLSQLPVPVVIDRLVAAGLDSIPGGGAEILVDRVRRILNCYSKATADEWLAVMRHAHRAGLRTTATMMYGTVETLEERIEHLFRLRELQDETGGFTAFIAWSFQPAHTELGGTEATGIEYLRTLALARIVLDNFDNLQASWVTQGGKVGQLSLGYGANDMGSVMIEENVVRAAGAEYCMDEVEVVGNIENAGFVAKRRNMHYDVLGDPIFRERAVPRMLELAVARADGRPGEADDLRDYEARSAAGRTRRAGTRTAVNPEPGTRNPEPGTRVFRAHWLLPITAPPIDGGWIEVVDGRIATIGHGLPPGPCQDLGDVVVLPGLVNAHTHLELSGLAGRIPPAERMVDWIRALMAARRASPSGPDPERARAIREAVAELDAAGTVLVGDVTNTLEPVPALRESRLAGAIFYELLGFREANPAGRVDRAWSSITPVPRFACSVVAHAPYSVSAALFTAIARRRQSTAPLSVHLAESAEEVEFLHTGTGPFRDLLDELEVWTDDWTPPACDPVEYLDRLEYLQDGTIVVHGVHLTDDALDRLRDRGGVLVTCPRSNVWVGAGLPRIAHAYAEGVRVAIGTDSLASVPTLSIFDELAELRRIAPDVAAAKLLESATRAGAHALGFGREYGTLSPGKRAALVAVDTPADVTDVEEYLVSGVAATAIRRVR